jgi:hypothetical protein
MAWYLVKHGDNFASVFMKYDARETSSVCTEVSFTSVF